MIAGLIPPDSGTITIGQTVKMGYYAQEIASENSADGKEIDLSYMDPNQRVIDYVKERAEYIQTVDGPVSASVMLDRFLFSPEAVQSDREIVRWGKEAAESASGSGNVPELHFAG